MLKQSHLRQFADTVQEILGASGYLLSHFMAPNHAEYMLDKTKVQDEDEGVAQVSFGFEEDNVYSSQYLLFLKDNLEYVPICRRVSPLTINSCKAFMCPQSRDSFNCSQLVYYLKRI